MSQSIGKIAAERNQRMLAELVAKPGNDVCADCKTRHPRWASHNLGIFICLKCAAIHRKIGTHITKVKSLTLDTWTKEQVDRMKEMGNVKSNAYFNPNEIKNPPPTNMIEQERDSDLEKYIRGKYEFKKYLDKSAIVAAQLGPSRSLAQVNRPKSTPLVSSGIPVSSTVPPVSATKFHAVSPNQEVPSSSRAGFMSRSVSQPISTPQAQAQTQPLPKSSYVWDDLLSLETSSKDTSHPLQFAPQPSPIVPSSFPLTAQPSTFSNLNPYLNNQTHSIPYAPQMSNTSANPGFISQSSFNPTVAHSSSFIAPSTFDNSIQPSAGNPFSTQQFGGGRVVPSFSSQGLQPQMSQQTQFQQPFLSSMPSQAPSNPFFAQQQQLQPGMFMGPQASVFAPPFGQQQQQQQQQPMFTQENAFAGWQGQPGGFPVQQQPWG